jgi:hypothetical protein
MRDLVTVHVAADLQMRSRALPFADRIEIRFGKAFPVVLLIDRGAIEELLDSIQTGQAALNAATKRSEEG